MKIQKNWVGYIVWGLFSIVLFSNIAFCAFKLAEIGVSKFSPIITIAMFFGIIILGSVISILLYILFMKFLYNKIFVEQQDPSGERSFIEIVLFAFALFTAIFLRIIVLVAIGGEYTGDDTYYRLALGLLTHSAADLETNGAIIYSDLLNIIFNIFGKKFKAVLILQIILQIGTILFTYFGTKKAFGKLVAWVSFLSLCFMPSNFMAINTMNPALFFLFFFSLFFWILTLSVNENYVKPSNQFIHVCSYVILGVFSAFLTYFDVSGLITVVLAFVFLLYKKEDADEDNISFEQKPIVRLLLYAVSFFVGLFLLLFFVSRTSSIGFEALFEFLINLSPQKGFDFYLLTPTVSNWDCLIPLFLVCIWFFSYLKSNSANGIPFALAIILLFISNILKLDIYPYELFYNLLWAVLSGIGLKSLTAFNSAIVSKENNRTIRESRKAQKELKRSFEAGEKSINLNNLDPQKVDPPTYNFDSDVASKNYGVGRKAEEEPVTESPSVMPNQTPHIQTPMPSQVPPVSSNVSNISEQNISSENKNVPPVKTKVAQVPVLPKDIIPVQPVKTNPVVNNMNINDSQTNIEITPPSTSENHVEKKLEDNPIVQNTVVKQSAPMRRGYRTPSKSTFSPEELERIKQHTNGEFAYHTKEEMMRTSSGPKQETVLKNNFINVIPDSRPQSEEKNNTQSDVDKSNISHVQAETKTDSANKQMEKKSDDFTQSAAPSLPPLVKDKLVEEQPKLIKNPLPGPKPHVSRELNYDYIPKDNEMDFDLKDLSGKDYYDI